MSESRKNHLVIDGGQVKEDEHIATYKAIPEADTEFRSSKSNLGKSKERVSDEAQEKLLEKEDEAKITTRVDMADAKYVVGDHRNGDAKIELDASKRQFSGLTKEELLKYAEDPFWVRLRWFMFVLFWALWLCMLVGAIAIIVRAPKCAPPPPKTWYQKGPLVDLSSAPSYEEIQPSLPALQRAQIQGVFIDGGVAGDTYRVLEDDSAIDQFKAFVTKAKEYGIQVIVDLTANFVPKSHAWFELSENKSGEYETYFIWANGKGFDEATGEPKPPNNWVSTENTGAWSWSPRRQQFFLAQLGADRPLLNFTDPRVVKRFDQVLVKWLQAGARGVRLVKARELLIDPSLQDESPRVGSGSDLGSDHTQYSYWKHKHTTDQPDLDSLFLHWAHLVDSNVLDEPNTGNTVFTVLESGSRAALAQLARNVSALRPPGAAPLSAASAPALAAPALRAALAGWPALQLVAPAGAGEEVASLAMLLPAAPVLDITQIDTAAADNATALESFSRLAALRHDASVAHGAANVTAVRANNSTLQLLVCARWKSGHTGYAAVWNPNAEELRADVSEVTSLPDAVTLHHASAAVRAYTNYTNNQALESNNLLVPPLSTVVVSYVPKTTADK